MYISQYFAHLFFYKLDLQVEIQVFLKFRCMYIVYAYILGKIN